MLGSRHTRFLNSFASIMPRLINWADFVYTSSSSTQIFFVIESSFVSSRPSSHGDALERNQNIHHIVWQWQRIKLSNVTNFQCDVNSTWRRFAGICLHRGMSLTFNASENASWSFPRTTFPQRCEQSSLNISRRPRRLFTRQWFVWSS